jgi:flagellar assembly factor FliW
MIVDDVKMTATDMYPLVVNNKKALSCQLVITRTTVLRSCEENEITSLIREGRP